MNTHPPKTGGRFKGVDYFDGGLFTLPARLELQMSELELLREATTFDWSKVQPEIFGTLFQHSLGRDDRRTFGAHFTHPADIMKIVSPTIVDPWRQQIEGAKTLSRLLELRDRLHRFRVLDPPAALVISSTSPIGSSSGLKLDCMSASPTSRAGPAPSKCG